MPPTAVPVRAERNWWRQLAIELWARRWRIFAVTMGYFLARLCEYAPDGWPFTACELLHRLLKAFGA